MTEPVPHMLAYQRVAKAIRDGAEPSAEDLEAARHVIEAMPAGVPGVAEMRAALAALPGGES